MFTAYILGNGRRFAAGTLEELLSKLRCDRLHIPHSEQARHMFTVAMLANELSNLKEDRTNAEGEK